MATLAPGLARKVKKALSIKFEAPELSQALTTLSDILEENTAATRRQLKASIEHSLVDINGEFLDSTARLMQELVDVQAKLTGLSRTCDSITSTLVSSNSSTAQLLEHTDALAAELAATQRKAEVVDRFLSDYQLRPDDAEVLQTGDVNDRFFAALARVHAIHENCRSLLHTHHQRAGLDLLDSMSSYQEHAYERLCKWVQLQCQSLTDVDAAEVHPLLASAAVALRGRPVLLRYCADEVATARHNAVFQSFLVALTQGGPGGVPRPIEMHAHNPRRYVGDMFAWVHQAIANERELLTSLFDSGAGQVGEHATSGSPRPDADVIQVSAMLDKVFEGICRPLRVRVEQLLLSAPSMLLCFHLYQLLSFYSATLTGIMAGPSALSAAVAQVRDMAAAGFHEQMKNRTDKLLRSAPTAPRDLACPAEIRDLVNQLIEVAEAFEGSMNAGLPGDSAAKSFDALLATVLAPLLEACQRSADALGVDVGDATAPSSSQSGDREPAPLPTMPANADKMYLLNCLLAIWAPFSVRRSCAQQAADIKARIDQQAAALAEAETRRLLTSCGMAATLDRARGYLTPPDAPTAPTHVMAVDPELSLTHITERLRGAFLLVSSADAVPEYEQVAMPRIRVDVSRRVAHGLAAAYSELYDAVVDERNGYGLDAAAAVKNPPAQVATLLGIQEPGAR